jgi:hypothetical protein
MLISVGESCSGTLVLGDVVIAFSLLPIANSLATRASANSSYVDRFIRQQDRDESTLAFLLAEDACAAILRTSVNHVRVRRVPVGNHDRSTRLICDGLEGLSVSHSGGLAVAVASNRRVGTDVEAISSFERFEPFLRQRWRAHAEHGIDFWVAQEAAYKLDTATPTDQILFSLAGPNDRWRGAIAIERELTHER